MEVLDDAGVSTAIASISFRRSDHFPVGVSSPVKRMPSAITVMIMKGTIKDTRQATWALRCWFFTRESKTAGMTKYYLISRCHEVECCIEPTVIPPPELPHPPAKALEVPTTFLSKNPVDQTWQGTKE